VDLHQLAALRSAVHHRFARPAGSGPSAPTLWRKSLTPCWPSACRRASRRPTQARPKRLELRVLRKGFLFTVAALRNRSAGRSRNSRQSACAHCHTKAQWRSPSSVPAPAPCARATAVCAVWHQTFKRLRYPGAITSRCRGPAACGVRPLSSNVRHLRQPSQQL